MIRIDDERWGEGEFVVNSFPLEITMVRSDAWDKKRVLMHQPWK